MKRSFFSMIVAFASVPFSTVVLAGSFAVGSVGTVPGVTPDLANGYNGQYLGTEVRGWLYPAGMKTPPNSKPTFGQFGTMRYAMILSRDSSSLSGNSPFGIDQDENEPSNFEFQRTVSHKLLRIVVDSRQDKRLESELLSADKPIALEGQVSGSASPILTLQQIAEPKADDTTSSAIDSANPVASRSSQITRN
jgi:hypothetical protein